MVLTLSRKRPLIGSFWLMYAPGFNFSIAVGVGFIALAGASVEIGVIMLVYLNQAWALLAENRSHVEDGIS